MSEKPAANARSPQPQLGTPVQFIPGIGPDRAEFLLRLDLRTASDLLFHFPRRYEPMVAVKRIVDLVPDKIASIVARVHEVDGRVTANGKHLTGVLFRDETGYVRGLWFNQPFMRQRFRRGERMLVTGAPRPKGAQWELIHPEYRALDEDENPDGNRISPVYGLTEGFSQAQMRRCQVAALKFAVDLVPEVLPSAFREAHRLGGIGWALEQIHQPSDEASLAAARRRFAFQELFVQQLALLRHRQERRGRSKAPVLLVDSRLDARIRRLFPFPFTPGQDAVIKEFRHDLGRSEPMNRLLLGDVGSGKTALAIYAILVTTAHAHQAVLMAPTEVLARQHHRTITDLLAASRVRVAFWSGGLNPSQRKETKERLENGEIDLLVGTPGIVQGDLTFPRLGLVVIDEQHRFGVRQRGELRSAAENPHVLVMTATPIPRTLAMLAYGDLDVSILRESPAGRQPVHTYLVAAAEREKWWEFYREQLRGGRQGFVIVPRVGRGADAPGDEELASLKGSYEALCHGELEAFRLDLIHGSMRVDEQAIVMERFARGETQVLVATSLVEIGLDIPNASVMVVENAERFGLAQLHQLRGRVGRGSFPGYVALFSEATQVEARERLEALSQIADGFELAEMDLRQRGPGDLLGTRQHGVATFRVAKLPDDGVILSEARRAAETLLAQGATRDDPDLAGLWRQVDARYEQLACLGDVG